MSIPGLDSLTSDDAAAPASQTAVAEVTTAEKAENGISKGEKTKQTPPLDDDSTTPANNTNVSNNSKLCGICNSQEGKYKCSRCYLPYCSVTCSKQHNTSHPPDKPKPATSPFPPPETKPHNPRLGTAAAAGQKHPFSILDTSSELQALFSQFPNLRQQLDQIDRATLKPDEDYGGDGGGGPRGKRKEGWNPGKGMQKGVEALKRARGVYGKDGEGVREYGRLVLQLLERGEEKGFIQKELEDESVQLIRQLLEIER